MKQFPHIISKLYREPCLLTPARHAAICQLVEARLDAAPGPVEVDAEVENETEIEPTNVGDTVIIPVHGTIVPFPEDIAMSECGCALEELGSAIDAVEADNNIRRVIYDFRTPGGTVTGIPELGRKIAASRKQTIAFTQSECCSGGIWLAAQCQRFYATQSSRVGSVGVYTLAMDLTEQLKMEGVKVNAISAGKYKLLGAYFKPLTDDERAILQARVDKIYAQFKDAMETWRVVADENFGNGLVFDGEEAAQLGFTDGVVESIEDIIEGMVE